MVAVAAGPQKSQAAKTLWEMERLNGPRRENSIKMVENVVGVDGIDYGLRAHNSRVVMAIGVVTVD